MARHKGVNWNLPERQLQDWTQVSVAVLMDIRDELQTLNRIMSCFQVARMSNDINRIDRRLAKHAPLKAKK